MLYAIMLAAFELSPLPFALGTLELVWLALVNGTGLPLPGLLTVEAYRLFRGLPLLLLMLFYLPRYKMSVKDLFDFRYEHFALEGYEPHPHIKAEVAV